MRTFVDRPDGSRLKLDLWRNITLREYRQFVYDNCPYLHEPYSLLFNGQILPNNEMTFEDYGIEQGDVLTIWHERMPDAEERLTYLQSPEGIPRPVRVNSTRHPVRVERPLDPVVMRGPSRLMEGDDYTLTMFVSDQPPRRVVIDPPEMPRREARVPLTNHDIEVFCRYYVNSTGDAGEDFTSRFPDAGHAMREQTFSIYLEENKKMRERIEEWLENQMYPGENRLQQFPEDEQLRWAIRLSLESYNSEQQSRRGEPQRKEPQSEGNLKEEEAAVESDDSGSSGQTVRVVSPQLPDLSFLRIRPAEEDPNRVWVVRESDVNRSPQEPYRARVARESQVNRSLQETYRARVARESEVNRPSQELVANVRASEDDGPPQEPVFHVRRLGRGRGRGPFILRDSPRRNAMVTEQQAAEISRSVGESSRASSASSSPRGSSRGVYQSESPYAVWARTYVDGKSARKSEDKNKQKEDKDDNPDDKDNNPDDADDNPDDADNNPDDLK